MRILLICLMLTGCATPPQWLATMYDSNDPCQNSRVLDPGGIEVYEVNGVVKSVVRPAVTTAPSYCGAGSGRAIVTREYYSNRPVFNSR